MINRAVKIGWTILTLGAIAWWLASCETTTGYAKNQGHRRGYARVTFYNPLEWDKIKVGHGRHRHYKRVCFGRRTSSGVKAIEGVTAASNNLPLGAKVTIPKLNGLVGSGNYVIQDTGAGDRILGAKEWIDVFVDNKRKTKWLATALPEWLEYTTQ